jgi:hypothetical protein
MVEGHHSRWVPSERERKGSLAGNGIIMQRTWSMNPKYHLTFREEETAYE